MAAAPGCLAAECWVSDDRATAITCTEEIHAIRLAWEDLAA
jgi:hypothetical protein